MYTNICLNTNFVTKTNADSLHMAQTTLEGRNKRLFCLIFNLENCTILTEVFCASASNDC